MVGHDLKMDEGIGTCGKDGQSVPVGVGMPTIKLDKMTVGGCRVPRSGFSDLGSTNPFGSESQPAAPQAPQRRPGGTTRK
jgi:hypothetical protein